MAIVAVIRDGKEVQAVNEMIDFHQNHEADS
jgi:hypothetical protein